jgi:hypothetical protein
MSGSGISVSAWNRAAGLSFSALYGSGVAFQFLPQRLTAPAPNHFLFSFADESGFVTVSSGHYGSLLISLQRLVGLIERLPTA